MRIVMMAVLAAAAAVSSVAGEKLVSDGQTVVFLGDSITHYGAVTSVSFAEYDKLLDLARKENVPLSEICQKSLVRGVKE